MSREERKKAKQERKEARRERRAKKPSRVRLSFMEMSDGVKTVKEMYREMNLQLNGEYEPEPETAEEEEAATYVPKLRHSKGMFKIRTKPSTWDVFFFMMDHELRTASGIIGTAVDIAVFILFIMSLFSQSNMSKLITLGIMVLTLLVVGPTNILLQAMSAAARLRKEENGATYTFSNSGFDILYASEKYVRFKWDDLYLAREGEYDFFIYLDFDDGFVIPKKDIAAAGRKAEQFAELLTEKAGDRYTVKRILKKFKKSQKV